MKKRDTLTIQLPDGYRVRLSNIAKKENLTISDMIRRAIRKFLGL